MKLAMVANCKVFFTNFLLLPLFGCGYLYAQCFIALLSKGSPSVIFAHTKDVHTSFGLDWLPRKRLCLSVLKLLNHKLEVSTSSQFVPLHGFSSTLCVCRPHKKHTNTHVYNKTNTMPLSISKRSASLLDV